jgi:hypothetical protein
LGVPFLTVVVRMKKILLFSLVGLLALPLTSTAAAPVAGTATDRTEMGFGPKKKFKKRKRAKARRSSRGFLGLGKKNGCGCPKY